LGMVTMILSQPLLAEDGISEKFTLQWRTYSAGTSHEKKAYACMRARPDRGRDIFEEGFNHLPEELEKKYREGNPTAIKKWLETELEKTRNDREKFFDLECTLFPGNVDLTRVQLQGADLQGANLSFASLQDAQLDSATQIDGIMGKGSNELLGIEAKNWLIQQGAVFSTDQ